jgi:hypothetical protein
MRFAVGTSSLPATRPAALAFAAAVIGGCGARSGLLVSTATAGADGGTSTVGTDDGETSDGATEDGGTSDVGRDGEPARAIAVSTGTDRRG